MGFHINIVIIYIIYIIYIINNFIYIYIYLCNSFIIYIILIKKSKIILLYAAMIINRHINDKEIIQYTFKGGKT